MASIIQPAVFIIYLLALHELAIKRPGTNAKGIRPVGGSFRPGGGSLRPGGGSFQTGLQRQYQPSWGSSLTGSQRQYQPSWGSSLTGSQRQYQQIGVYSLPGSQRQYQPSWGSSSTGLQKVQRSSMNPIRLPVGPLSGGSSDFKKLLTGNQRLPSGGSLLPDSKKPMTGNQRPPSGGSSLSDSKKPMSGGSSLPDSKKTMTGNQRPSSGGSSLSDIERLIEALKPPGGGSSLLADSNNPMTWNQRPPSGGSSLSDSNNPMTGNQRPPSGGSSLSAICGGVVKKDIGQIQSPNYPNDYLPNKECIWKISVAQGYRVGLTFQSFKMEVGYSCNRDYLEVRDGNSENSPLLGRFCGSNKPDDIKTSSNQLWMKFVSDGTLNYAGFNANFFKDSKKTMTGNQRPSSGGSSLSELKEDENICGGEVKKDMGQIQSPNYPDNYLPNKVCIWKISVAQGYHVGLTFQSFEMQGVYSCDNDYLEVRDGNSENSPLLGRFCGYDKPDDIKTSSNQLWMKFVSDDFLNRAGFNANFFIAESGDGVRVGIGIGVGVSVFVLILICCVCCRKKKSYCPIAESEKESEVDYATVQHPSRYAPHPSPEQKVLYSTLKSTTLDRYRVY